MLGKAQAMPEYFPDIAQCPNIFLALGNARIFSWYCPMLEWFLGIAYLIQAVPHVSLDRLG
jgi:hypothetical protein